MYKLSNDTVEIISLVIKESDEDYEINNKEDMEEFCFALGFFVSLAGKKADTKESKEMLAKATATMEEIYKHIEEIDYEDLNQRIKL